MNPIEKLIFGEGFCKGCEQIKPLVMVEAVGMTEDKVTGELIEAQNFSDMTHRQSLGWHGAPRGCSRRACRRLTIARGPSPHPLQGVAGFIGIGGRLASESVAGMDRNHWLLCVGIRTHL